uniref:Small integral membrane protein 14 n=1 Tax=Caenorhabditis japonica TaxID=281687 RepID=A0A8R1I9Y9_CAEJA
MDLKIKLKLRSSQGECTDTGCDTDGFSREGGNPLFLWTLLWTFMAMALYVMRPASMRSRPANSGEAAIEKPTGANDTTQPPPPPPPSAM